MSGLITRGSYRCASGRLLGTNCPCGRSCGPGNGYFCNGYKGDYDTYLCYCDCHATPAAEPEETL